MNLKKTLIGLILIFSMIFSASVVVSADPGDCDTPPIPLVRSFSASVVALAGDPGDDDTPPIPLGRSITITHRN